MNNNNEVRVRRSDKAICRVIDGEAVVLIPEEAMLYVLGGCGNKVWDLIEKEISISEVLDVIYEEYDVEPEIAKKDITEFLNDLKALNLVEMVEIVSKEAGQ